MSGLLYLEHLTEADLALLAAAAGEESSATDWMARLRARPHLVEALLGRPELFDALLGPGDRDALLRASPFLIFAVLVNRATHDLAQARFVQEWVGPSERVPVFDVSGLQEFAADSLRRLFLAELLASYTRVASGSYWVHTGRGWRRRRFSDLDPIQLIQLLEVVPEHERPAVCRRLGDLALFLTGVFPDHAGGRLLPPTVRERLRKAVERDDEAGGRDHLSREDATSAIWLLEAVGRRSYRAAFKAARVAGTGRARVLGDVAERFGQARRILNFVTERYVFPFRERWFPLARS